MATSTVQLVEDVLNGKLDKRENIDSNYIFKTVSAISVGQSNYEEILIDSGFYTESDLKL